MTVLVSTTVGLGLAGFTSILLNTTVELGSAGLTSIGWTLADRFLKNEVTLLKRLIFPGFYIIKENK